MAGGLRGWGVVTGTGKAEKWPAKRSAIYEPPLALTDSVARWLSVAVQKVIHNLIPPSSSKKKINPQLQLSQNQNELNRIKSADRFK